MFSKLCLRRLSVVLSHTTAWKPECNLYADCQLTCFPNIIVGQFSFQSDSDNSSSINELVSQPFGRALVYTKDIIYMLCVDMYIISMVYTAFKA